MTSPSPRPTPCLDDCLECWLRSELETGHCNGSLYFVHDWLEARQFVRADLIDFLDRHGGFCDCEVLLNVLLGGRLTFGNLVLSCGH
ncbi:MAG: hypothetical protein QOG99_2052 [Frankiales bacterium]|jgi:hypothetical protein|nr:hypothetical protein [Frankiales bacterium]